MIDVENSMIIEPLEKKQRVYAYCDHCEEPIYANQEVTICGDGEIAIICHSQCFDNFIESNKETFVAKERM